MTKLIQLIFGMALTLLALLVLYSLAQSFTGLPFMADRLPAESTQAFLIVKDAKKLSTQPIWPLSTEVLGIPITDWPGFTGHMASTFIADEEVTMMRFWNRASARKTLNQLKLEEEPYTHSEGITCFAISHSSCFLFLDNWLAISESQEALVQLSKVATGTPSLAEQPRFQNVRNRLPSLSKAFLYVDLERLGQWETLGLFPALGGTLKWEKDHWSMEAFLAVDKSKLSGQAFYRSSEKYQASLLPLVPQDYDFAWGGEDLGALYGRALEILQNLDPTLAAKFQTSAAEWFSQHFGLTDISAKTGEFFLGFSKDGQAIALFEDTVDTNQAGQEDKPYSDLGALLTGSDGLLRLRVNFLTERPIVITVGHKLFDDGVYARSELQFE